MTSAEQMESLAAAMEDLLRGLQALGELACRDAHGAAIEQAVLRCESAFSRMEERVRGLDPAMLHREDGGLRIGHLVRELSCGYAACLESLAAASNRVAIQIGAIQRRRSASREYQKIAGLG